MALIHAPAIRYISRDEFLIIWFVGINHKWIRYPRRQQRFVDRKSAERFAKRWGISIPEASRQQEKRDQAAILR
jgi:hypothetical protein